MSERARGWALFGAVVAMGVAADQVTKQLADAHLRSRGIVTVIDGFFDLRYARNPGAFFSLGAGLEPGLRRLFFVAASLGASALILRLFAQTPPSQRILRWALMLLLAGAFGNLVDRVLWGEVIDFVHLYWRGVFDWATFNIADVLITVGLGFIVIDTFTSRREAAPQPASSDTP